MTLSPIAEIGTEFYFQTFPSLDRAKCEREFARIATLVPDTAGTRTRGGGGDLPAFQQGNAGASFREVPGNRATLDSATDNDDLRAGSVRFCRRHSDTSFWIESLAT